MQLWYIKIYLIARHSVSFSDLIGGILNLLKKKNKKDRQFKFLFAKNSDSSSA